MTKLALASLLILSRLSFAADASTEHIRNFGQVNPNVFRGGEPTGEALNELQALGVNLVLDLRENGASGEEEKEKVESLGMRYVHIPMRAIAVPRQAEIAQALSLLLNQPTAKIYVHCRRGKDRTGTVIACYRIQHDGWDNRRALDEAKSYGMSRLERGMQSYIVHFTPITPPTVAGLAH